MKIKLKKIAKDEMPDYYYMERKYPYSNEDAETATPPRRKGDSFEFYNLLKSEDEPSMIVFVGDNGETEIVDVHKGQIHIFTP